MIILGFYGAPGTGKTMFAEAVAHELNLPLFVVTPSEIFKSHVGESEESVKKLFHEMDLAEEGSVLFVDECESIFSTRSSDTEDYKAAVTTELLQRINGFGNDGSKRIMIGATNRPQDIDPAYLRYKRFSHHVHITPPDDEAIHAIVKSKLKGIELEAGLTCDDVFEMVTNYIPYRMNLQTGEKEKVAYYSAADICAIMEEACRLALEELQAKDASQPIPLTKAMFIGKDVIVEGKQVHIDGALNKVHASISAEVLAEYSNFEK